MTIFLVAFDAGHRSLRGTLSMPSIQYLEQTILSLLGGLRDVFA